MEIMTSHIFRPEKECPELPDPDNGQVHISGRHFQVSLDIIISTEVTLYLTSHDVRTRQCTLVKEVTPCWGLPRGCVRLAAPGQGEHQSAETVPGQENVNTNQNVSSIKNLCF